MSTSYEQLAEQLEHISVSTVELVELVAEVRSATTERLDQIETELTIAQRQQQQAILLLTELAKGH